MMGVGIAPVRLSIVTEPGEQLRSIQVVSLSSVEGAEQVQDTLRERGITTQIETTDAGYHRVVVADVALSDIERVVAELAEAGFASVLVRSR
jgi:hypothetical protein